MKTGLTKAGEIWFTASNNDIAIGAITIKALPKGGWILPGGVKTQNRKVAESAAKKINAQYMRLTKSSK